MAEDPTPVVNVDELTEIDRSMSPWGASYKVLTPTMRPQGGSLGVNWLRVPPGHTTCPFHYHLREDEAFFVLSGRGVMRYGDTVQQLRAGDCVSCPAGPDSAHQIANPYDEDLVYLAIGRHDPHEVCVYPDNGKVMVRGIAKIGHLAEADYLAGEPERPKIFDMTPS
ncbi:MAG: cupin domain-containing protein [Planctomycetota bacterium]